MSLKTISPTQLAERRNAGIRIEVLDVRTPAEFREIHLEDARLVPLDRLDPQAVMRERNVALTEPLYVVCRSGSRGKQACEKFYAAGFENVVNIEGGTLACEQAGLSVVRGQKTMSLERQVRIVAGFLVLLGTFLGWFIHPNWLGLPALIGAGLMFAGITDTCGMGMLLARMPWNQAGEGVLKCE